MKEVSCKHLAERIEGGLLELKTYLQIFQLLLLLMVHSWQKISTALPTGPTPRDHPARPLTPLQRNLHRASAAPATNTTQHSKHSMQSKCLTIFMQTCCCILNSRSVRGVFVRFRVEALVWCSLLLTRQVSKSRCEGFVSRRSRGTRCRSLTRPLKLHTWEAISSNEEASRL